MIEPLTTWTLLISCTLLALSLCARIVELAESKPDPDTRRTWEESDILTACHHSDRRDMILHGYEPSAHEVAVQVQEADPVVPHHHTDVTHQIRRN